MNDIAKLIGEDNDYRKAKRYVEAKLGFFFHAFVYAGVMAVLFFINLSTSTETWWVQWPAMGWGLGLFFHGLSLLFFSGGASVKERMLARELDKTY